MNWSRKARCPQGRSAIDLRARRVLHNNIRARTGSRTPAALPWPDGDRYIQKANAGVYSVPPDPAIAARSAAVIAREQAARDNIATPVTGFAETLRTGDQAEVHGCARLT